MIITIKDSKNNFLIIIIVFLIYEILTFERFYIYKKFLIVE